MMKLKSLIAGLVLGAFTCVPALAQSVGQLGSGQMWANATANQGRGNPTTASAYFDFVYGNTRGAILERGASGWVKVNPSSTAGLPWISNGTGADPSYSSTLPANLTFSGQLLETGTSAPSSAAGQTVMLGTLSAAPTLANTGQGFVFNSAANGAVIQGDGSTYDAALLNKSGSVAIGIPTGATAPAFPGLASGTCVNSLLINSSNQMITGACPGAAASIQVGSTTVTSGLTGNLLYNNAGTLGNETIASVLTAGSGISITGTTSATIAQSLTNTTLQASPANPANLTSASFLMEGFGTTCHITPTYSGRLHVSFNFDIETGTAGVSLTTKVMFGTGAAPANAAAVTGTQVANVHSVTQQVGADFAAVTHGAYVITGLTPGTAYWLDIAAQGDGTHAFAMADVSCSAMEF